MVFELSRTGECNFCMVVGSGCGAIAEAGCTGCGAGAGTAAAFSGL